MVESAKNSGNCHRIRYGGCSRFGMQIGSNIIESSCKQVVVLRTIQRGLHPAHKDQLTKGSQ